MTKQAPAKVCTQQAVFLFSVCRLNLGSILLVCASAMEVEAFCHEGLARFSPIFPFPSFNIPNHIVRTFHVYLSASSIFFFGCPGFFYHPAKEKAATMPSGGHGCSPIRALTSSFTGWPISPRSERAHKPNFGEPIVQSDDAQNMSPTTGMGSGQRLEEHYNAVISVLA